METRAAGIGLLHSSAANCSGSIHASSLSPEKAALYKKPTSLLIEPTLAERYSHQVSSVVNPKPFSVIFLFYVMGRPYLSSR